MTKEKKEEEKREITEKEKKKINKGNKKTLKEIIKHIKKSQKKIQEAKELKKIEKERTRLNKLCNLLENYMIEMNEEYTITGETKIDKATLQSQSIEELKKTAEELIEAITELEGTKEE